MWFPRSSRSRRKFDGIIETTVPFFPTLPGREDQDQGIPQFYNVFTKTLMGFDVPNLKHQGRVPAGNTLLLGNWNGGKTALTQNWAYRQGLRQVDGELFRMAANNLRGTASRPEWLRFCQLKGTKIYNIAQMHMNLIHYDLPFTNGQLLESVKGKIELARHQRLEGEESEALKLGLQKVRRDCGRRANVPRLVMSLRSLNGWDALKSYSESLAEEHERSADDPTFAALVEEDFAFSSGLLEAARRVAGYLSDLLDGAFGDLYGGDESPIEMFENPNSVKNFQGMTREQIASAQSWFWEIFEAAVALGKRFLYPDMYIADEFHAFLPFIEFIRPMAKLSKTVRDTDIWLVCATHRFSDFETGGDSRSEQYKLAMNMLNDFCIFLLAEHTIEASHETKQRLGLTEIERRYLLNVPVGTYGLKLPNEPMQMVRWIQTPLEKWMNESNTANNRKAITPPARRRRTRWFNRSSHTWEEERSLADIAA